MSTDTRLGEGVAKKRATGCGTKIAARQGGLRSEGGGGLGGGRWRTGDTSSGRVEQEGRTCKTELSRTIGQMGSGACRRAGVQWGGKIQRGRGNEASWRKMRQGGVGGASGRSLGREPRENRAESECGLFPRWASMIFERVWRFFDARSRRLMMGKGEDHNGHFGAMVGAGLRLCSHRVFFSTLLCQLRLPGASPTLLFFFRLSPATQPLLIG